MCGMAVTIWSTCGFERKYVGMAVPIWSTVWYGMLQFGQLLGLSASMCGMAVLRFERKNGCAIFVCVVWLLQFGQLVVSLALSVKMCGMAVTIWSTCGFEHKYVWYGCYNLVNWWF